MILTPPSEKSLFKYMPWRPGNNFFNSPMLRFSQPETFNDPFEGFPQLSSIKQKIHGNGVSSSIIENWNLKDLQFKYIDIGILCLTARNDNLLMWSHYANEHQGIVLEFDMEHKFFKQDIPMSRKNSSLCRHKGKPWKVQYRTDRHESASTMESAYDRFFVKSTDWRYEEEYRMILDFNGDHNIPIAVTRNVEKDPNDRKSIFLFPLPVEAIKGVYLGCRTYGENKDNGNQNNIHQEIIDEFNDAKKNHPHYENVTINFAQMHNEEFKLDFIEQDKWTPPKNTRSLFTAVHDPNNWDRTNKIKCLNAAVYKNDQGSLIKALEYHKVPKSYIDLLPAFLHKEGENINLDTKQFGCSVLNWMGDLIRDAMIKKINISPYMVDTTIRGFLEDYYGMEEPLDNGKWLESK
ncbi:DUF2971 domain-containing protein [Microbulbifer sp. ANSA005]|uniref:DUF2971 domain-containing protein n=1 Tax=Microbulbifer sp. ANSA005 TaxID=3243362 RepID=UPI0040435FD9